MQETKLRSIIKTIIWRFIATLNSYFILVILTNSNKQNLYKAIIMNITGFFIYYIYERFWNLIRWGKI